MSEDEAIEILRDIPFFEQVENHDVNGPRWILKTNKRLAQARDMVLDLYKQEKEKNKELSTIKEGIRVLQNNGLMDEQYIVIANWNLKNTSYKHLLDDYILKDKIKAKIEEVKRKREEEWETAGISMLGSAIDVLLELLEEN